MAHRPAMPRKRLVMHVVCTACGAHIEHGMMNRHYDSLHQDVKKLVPEEDADGLDRPYDVHPLFRRSTRFASLFEVPPSVCNHTDAEIREMAHNLHVSEQAELIREAIAEDEAEMSPGFFHGTEDSDTIVPAP